uniref:CHHC U11-48K-type domain-containing protein n=1 Tax=Mola mola TaxID=94237 RepID=A0A3Q4BPN4_MOLML
MASTFRFGSSSSASHIWVKNVMCMLYNCFFFFSPGFKDNIGNCDPDKLLQCPFDKTHQIRASRFPYHLIKCRKNHPQLVSQLKTCPFNARHLVPVHELPHHTETCEDRFVLIADENPSGFSKWQVPASTWEMPKPSEDWDKGSINNQPQVDLLINLPEKRLNSHLGPNFRTPNTLPWSDFKS